MKKKDNYYAETENINKIVRPTTFQEERRRREIQGLCTETQNADKK